MSTIADQDYLLGEQYRGAANLMARIELHRRFSVNTYGWQRWVFDHLDLPAVCCVLELGCGPADLWRENLHRLPAGWDITLSDLSPGMLDQARQALAAAGMAPLPRFEIIDAQAIPFPDAAFDAVIANHMLYHVPDRPRALAEIRRVLKPGGRLYAATVGVGHLSELRRLVQQALPGAPGSDPAGQAFGLENGAAQLAPWFATVERDDYQDALVVSELEPLMAHIVSSRSWLGIAGDDAALEQLARGLRQRLAADGAIHIGKASGMFTARR